MMNIAVEPKSGRFESLEASVLDAGGTVGDIAEAEALIWADPHQNDTLPDVLAAGPSVRWVALPFAGIEPYVPFLDHERTWTCARGVYARPVAEHVIAMALGGMRNIVGYARAASWGAQHGVNLHDANVTVFGGGGITTELVGLLKGWNCDITVVRRNSKPFPGVTRTVVSGSTADRLDALRSADLVVLALALTDETHHLIGADELEAMQSHAWLVNVARGGIIDTQALVHCLAAGGIGGAALDVTDPEPLPDGHPLWSEPRCVITPHVGNTPAMGVPLLAAHISENVARFLRGDDLIGVVDVADGY